MLKTENLDSQGWMGIGLYMILGILSNTHIYLFHKKVIFMTSKKWIMTMLLILALAGCSNLKKQGDVVGGISDKEALKVAKEKTEITKVESEELKNLEVDLDKFFDDPKLMEKSHCPVYWIIKGADKKGESLTVYVNYKKPSIYYVKNER